MLDVAMIDAAAKAYSEEAKHWKRLPHHYPTSPWVAERHESLEQRSFVSRTPPPDVFTRHAFDTDEERTGHIHRVCMQAALEVALAETRSAA